MYRACPRHSMQYQIVFVAARPVEAERQQSFFGRNLRTHVFRTFLSSEPPKRVVFVAAPLVEADRKQRSGPETTVFRPFSNLKPRKRACFRRCAFRGSGTLKQIFFSRFAACNIEKTGCFPRSAARESRDKAAVFCSFRSKKHQTNGCFCCCAPFVEAEQKHSFFGRFAARSLQKTVHHVRKFLEYVSMTH